MRGFNAFGALALSVIVATGPAAAQNAPVDPLAAFRCEQAHVNANYGDALRLCRPLAEQGLGEAQLVLADLYQRGLGVPPDLGQAARWHRAAAEQGLGQAQFNLGMQYRYGSGVPQDLVEAHVWLSRAAEAGIGDATAALSLTERRMSQDQLAAANARRQAAAAPSTVSAASSEPTPDPATQRNTIAAAQSRLAQLGYAPGPADGLMGARTRTAIRQFQSNRGLPIDGQATAALVDNLDAALNERQAATVPAAAPAPTVIPSSVTAAGPVIDGPNADVQKLVEELKATLAGPAAPGVNASFVAALDDLVRRYDWPWSETVFSDDFADGSYLANPTWTVAAGQFSASAPSGLRTREVGTTQRQPSSSGGDVASQLLGAIVSEVLQSQLGTEPAATPEIFARAAVPNAFVVTVDMTAQGFEGRTNQLTIGLFQDERRENAYQLRYVPGPESRLDLVRTTAGGTSVIGSARLAQRIDDGGVHRVQWRRSADGGMAVLVDRNEIMRATDRGLSNNFVGVHIANQAGEYAIRRIVIHGLPT